MKNLNFLSRAIVDMVILLSGGLSAFAHDFEVDVIFYNFIDKIANTVEVTYKGDDFFSYDNEYAGAVIIPSSVTEIGDHAFVSCSELTSVTIPNSVN